MPSGMPDLRRHKPFYRLLTILLLSVWSCAPEPVETHLLLPVEFANVPKGMIVTQYRTDKIEIHIQGDPRLIETLSEKPIHYPADLYTDLDIDPAGASESIGPGYYMLPVEKRRIPMDPAIKILEISPSYLGVRLEKVITREFKVEVPFSGDLHEGLIALAPTTDPTSVTLSGAESLINEIQVLKTRPVDLTNARESFRKEMPLDIDSTRLVTADSPIIVVSVQIQEAQVETSIEHIPVQIRNSSFSARIEPDVMTIAIKGPYSIIHNKETLDRIYAFVDLEGMTPGVYARHSYINIPVGLAMTRSDPRVFTVTIEK
ncbi:MAG: CdaR family protein [Thermodesulfobacteriota bacterium]